jgi:hypothetical protein
MEWNGEHGFIFWYSTIRNMRGKLRFAYREQAGGSSEHMATKDFGGKRLQRRNSAKGQHRTYQLLQKNSNPSFSGAAGSRW